jgi:hypothetical protein
MEKYSNMLLVVTTGMPLIRCLALCVLFWVWCRRRKVAFVGIVKDGNLSLYLCKFSGISDITYVCMFVLGFSMWLKSVNIHTLRCCYSIHKQCSN